jgi:hypothetical protein
MRHAALFSVYKLTTATQVTGVYTPHSICYQSRGSFAFQYFKQTFNILYQFQLDVMDRK